MMSVSAKDPAAVIAYSMDWGADYLGGETLSASSWSIAPVEPGGLSVDTASFDTATTSVTVSGGVAGHSYHLTNRITTSSGQIDERSIIIRVQER
jgi:hypothetical protein